MRWQLLPTSWGMQRQLLSTSWGDATATSFDKLRGRDGKVENSAVRERERHGARKESVTRRENSAERENTVAREREHHGAR
ncbi:uncharacterized protein DS421_10g298000 [Arachis hypogaea]|nr:uncharacterized protein DS421_10g298000 [Arachis hypogaea]